MRAPRITYVSRPDATQEGELNALAAAYRFILFESRASKEGGPAITAPNDVEGVSENDSNAKVKCSP